MQPLQSGVQRWVLAYSAVVWNPGQYLRFESERALPFRHLVAAIDRRRPTRVIDLGCGPGALTVTLLERWPGASIVGIDSSPEMIDLARRRSVAGRLEFELGDITTRQSPYPVDVMISNACFQWVEDHRALLDHLLPQLNTGGTLAFQVPANHDAPSHTLLAELCASPRWRNLLGDLPRTGVRTPGWYINEMTERGLAVTVWQTSYHHLLSGQDPVLEWVRGSTLRPVLARLSADEQHEFTTGYGALLRKAYPDHDGITPFPFTRYFVVTSRQ